jgi:hypothetical protein
LAEHLVSLKNKYKQMAKDIDTTRAGDAQAENSDEDVEE